MRTVQMTIEETLLAEVDQMAEASQETRSAFTRAALQAEVKRRINAAKDEAHRKSFMEHPEDDIGYPAQRAWGDS